MLLGMKCDVELACVMLTTIQHEVFPHNDLLVLMHFEFATFSIGSATQIKAIQAMYTHRSNSKKPNG